MRSQLFLEPKQLYNSQNVTTEVDGGGGGEGEEEREREDRGR